MICNDCPRRCGIDRSITKGFCQEGDKIRVSKIIENFEWEEPCISGDKGALAIFFSGCNLRCQFCQNYDISHIGKGDLFAPEEFRKFLSSYDLSKFSSIDLVTPTHFSSLLIDALIEFDSPIPIVWNSSAYESTKTLEKLSSIVDVFLPDLKYYSEELSKKFSKAENYFEIASNAIKTMRRLKPENKFKEGVLVQGVLIRHLVLPGQCEDSKKVLNFISLNVNEPLISLMCQFTPTGRGELERKIYPLEYKIVINYAEKLDLTDGYIQEYTSADENFIPNF